MGRTPAKEPRKSGKKTAEALRAGARLRQARQALGLSLEDVSTKIDGKLGASRIGNYEQGLRELGIQESEMLAPALGQPAAYLMGLISETDRDLLMLPEKARVAAVTMAQSMGTTASTADKTAARAADPISRETPQKKRRGVRLDVTETSRAPLQRSRGA
jgi:transcriptional regulator with XRE-family HTH domain